jgi:hypothetical protein
MDKERHDYRTERIHPNSNGTLKRLGYYKEHLHHAGNKLHFVISTKTAVGNSFHNRTCKLASWNSITHELDTIVNTLQGFLASPFHTKNHTMQSCRKEVAGSAQLIQPQQMPSAVAGMSVATPCCCCACTHTSTPATMLLAADSSWA